jgi:4-diphosphocytidyl-2-C-methyl-D-erythritol kinase
MSETLTAASPAKINLTLRVTGVRPDGFHELESLVVQVNLCDTVAVTARDDDQLTLDCDVTGVPCNASNLAWRAAAALRAATGCSHGADIALTKRIPMGAGLGGGSSNAATTLVLLDRLWGLGLEPDVLAGIGADVGSDVPLFLYPSPCVMRGRGECVEPFAARGELWAAILLPELHCATPAVYGAWDGLDAHPPRPEVEEILGSLGDASCLMQVLFNDLEEAAHVVEPALADLAGQAFDATGLAVRLTGSGAAMFRLFDDAPSAARFALDVGTAAGVRVDIATVRLDEGKPRS